MVQTRAEAKEQNPAHPRLVDAVLVALGLGLTVAAAPAAVYASGFHLSQPTAPAHIIPLWVIVITLSTFGVLFLQSNALSSGRLAGLVCVVVGAVLGAVVLVLLRPAADVSIPVGAKLPWLLVSLAGVVLGCLVLLLVVVRRRRQATSPDAVLVPVGTVGGVVAVVIALGLVVAIGVGVLRVSADYLDRVNEYHENPLTGPGSSMRSELTGQVAWQLKSDPDPRLQAMTVPSGLVITEGNAVVELDAATGQVRWRYQRSDVDARFRPHVTALDGGRKLAVKWDSTEFVLDARTGTRVDRWQTRYSAPFDDDDPTLQQREVGVDETVLTAVDDHGRRQWQYQQKCHSLEGTRTTPVILVHVVYECGATTYQTVGLDPSTGARRWELDHALDVLAVVDSVAVTTTATPRGNVPTPATTLSGVDLASGSTRWTTAPIGPGGHTCTATKIIPQAGSLMVICVFSQDEGSTGHAWVQRYDVATGKLLDQADLGNQLVFSSTVTADGRMVVLGEAARAPRCHVTVIQADGAPTVLPLAVSDSFCSDDTVQALGDQVLLTQPIPGYLQALR